MRDGQWQRFHSPLSVFRIKPCWPRCFLWVVCSARSTSSSLCALIALLAHISLSGGHHFLFRLAVQGCKAWVSQKCSLAGVQPDLNVIFRIPFQMLDAGIVEFELWRFLTVICWKGEARIEKVFLFLPHFVHGVVLGSLWLAIDDPLLWRGLCQHQRGRIWIKTG